MKRGLAIICLLLFCLSTFQTIYADVIDPGEKELPTINYHIINKDSYPDYVFLLHGVPSPPYMVLVSGEFSFYKLSTASIYAVENSKFNRGELEGFNYTQIDDYFANNPNVIHSNLDLNGSFRAADQAGLIRDVIIELEITKLNQTSMEIKKNRIIYVFQDGTNKTAEYQDQNITPQPDNIPVNMIWYLAIPLVAAIAIILVILYRRSK